MIANVHSLRKVKLGGKDCTFKVRGAWEDVLKWNSHILDDKSQLSGRKDLQWGGDQRDWVSHCPDLCQWQGGTLRWTWTSTWIFRSVWKAFEVYWKPLFSPGEVDAKEESWRRFCPPWTRHWSRQGLSLVRDDFLWRRPGWRPFQMVVPYEMLKVKVHRCQCSLYSSGKRSKIQALVVLWLIFAFDKHVYLFSPIKINSSVFDCGL